jgi:FtsP/CotA-like multicopper oxidase with cupredoxin domain
MTIHLHRLMYYTHLSFTMSREEYISMGKTYRQVFVLFFILLFTPILYAQDDKPTLLQVVEKTMVVDGKKSRVFDVLQPDGTFGYVGYKGDLFNVIVKNKTREPLVLHWHGPIDPNAQDGVPYVTQYPIRPGGEYHYQFKLKQAGTYWMHSHYQLQEQKLMAAPLIIYDKDKPKEADALMFIQDFSFTDPNVIYSKLRTNLQHDAIGEDHAAMNHSMTDVSDVKFDAYLTNHQTLKHPSVKRVLPNQTVRLRIVNASASSNYYIDLGKLTGTLFAVDSEYVKPIQGSRFQIAIGNRLDIRVHIPKGEGVYPILALPEGTRQQTGLILATTNAKLPVFSDKTTSVNPILNDDQEMQLQPIQPLRARPINKSLTYNLEGNMKTYRWTINGQEWPMITPYQVKYGQRIELVFNNKSGMAHPMHLHGHIFQITEINGKKINGRKGDTVNIMPNASVKVVLDMDNPGIWMLHCHILYHQMGGMMTTLDYDNYPNKFTTKQRMEGEKLYGMSI